MKVTLRCESCHKQYADSERIWRCKCGGFLAINFHAHFPVHKIKKRKPTMWRYREALPLKNDEYIISFEEGFTPLIQDEFFGKKVFVKQDHLFPSGSFKDRGASVLISKIKELGINQVVEDSSGNAGAAIAAYCAKAYINCHIYVPEKTSAQKLMQIQQYGALVHKIPGSREDTAKATWHQAQTMYYASHYWNPYFFHGTKTYVFELVEQLGWMAPHFLIIPVGNGTLLYGAFIGLQELQREKIIDKFPKIIGVQAKNCAPLHYIWKTNTIHNYNKRTTETIAEGIAIAEPVREKNIIHAIKETNGAIITVTEREIHHALNNAFQKGYYIEPTSAVAIAGLNRYHFGKKALVVIPLTGHGLKTKIEKIKRK